MKHSYGLNILIQDKNKKKKERKKKEKRNFFVFLLFFARHLFPRICCIACFYPDLELIGHVQPAPNVRGE